MESSIVQTFISKNLMILSLVDFYIALSRSGLIGRGVEKLNKNHSNNWIRSKKN